MVILKGKLYRKSFRLDEGTKLVMGRGDDAEVQIFETSLSRHQCYFERCQGDVYVTDAGSSNGTWVNEQRITRHKLKNGDILRFGTVELEFSGAPERVHSSSSIIAAIPHMCKKDLKGNIQFLYGTVRALVAALEAKDMYTSGHSERVTAYAMQVARAMKLPPDALNNLELGGVLHDIGKIGTPERILNKPERLTDEEYAVVKQHPRMGYDILTEVEGTQLVAEMVLHHHERWDGKGYPDSLDGEKTSLSARILSAADALDAMGSARPYRKALPREQALAEIRRNAGTQFDPKVAEALLNEAEAGRIFVEWSRYQTIQNATPPA